MEEKIGVYRVTLQRQADPAVGDKVTFLLIRGGRPMPLADGGSLSFPCEDKVLQLSVFITDNKKKKLDGQLCLEADGNDANIVWTAAPAEPQLGQFRCDSHKVTFQVK